MIKSLIKLIICLLLIRCGPEYTPNEEKKDDLKEVDTIIVEEETNYGEFSDEEKAWIEAYEKANTPEQFLYIRGYISPFEVIIDDQSYSDSEEFYTIHLDKLIAEKNSNGYEDYDLELNADIGIKDLKKGMIVNITPNGDTGYAAEEILDWEGKFEVKFPVDAEDDDFTIRAIKKIDVSLTYGKYRDTIVKWCYNFYAFKTIKAKTGKPYIINNFSTKITKYKCSPYDYDLDSLASHKFQNQNKKVEEVKEVKEENIE